MPTHVRRLGVRLAPGESPFTVVSCLNTGTYPGIGNDWIEGGGSPDLQAEDSVGTVAMCCGWGCCSRWDMPTRDWLERKCFDKQQGLSWQNVPLWRWNILF